MNIFHDHKIKQNILNKIVRSCQHLLFLSDRAKNAREYLDSRLSRSNQLSWGFGYFPTDDELQSLTKFISKEDLEFLNLYYPKFVSGGSAPHGHFSDHNLVMPFHNVHDEIVAILGRCLISGEERVDAGLQKYKYSVGCQKDLYVYGLNKAKDEIIKKDCVICVEGQFDCITLHTLGVKNVVALGWANVSRFQMFQIHRYTNNIILMFDNDEAGKKAKKRIKNRHIESANIETVMPPEGFKDIDEFFRNCTDKTYARYVIDSIRSFGEINGKKI